MESVKSSSTYESTRRELFHKKYNPKGWIGRKIVAIPKALIAGIFKTIYHIGCIFFHGIPKALMGDNSSLKVYTFQITQDLREAYGWITTLFDDKLGQLYSSGSIYQESDRNLYDISKLTEQDILDLFPNNPEMDEANKERFTDFTVESIHKLFESLRSDIPIFYLRRFISDEYLMKIPVSQISRLFPNRPEFDEENKKIFHNIGQTVIQNWMQNELMASSLYLLSLVSEDQKKALNLSKLSRYTLMMLFPSFPDEQLIKTRSVVHSFSREVIQNWIQAEDSSYEDHFKTYNLNFIKLLSTEQKRAIDTSMLDPKLRKLIESVRDDIEK